MFCMPSRKKLDVFLLIVCTFVISILLFFIISSFFPFKDGDEWSFIYIATGILEGEIPYLDRWDHKGPLIYLLKLVGLMISELWGIWIVQTIFLILSVYFLFLTVKQNFDTPISLFCISIFLILLIKFRADGLTEYYSLLFQFIALYLFVLVERRNRRESWLPLAIGVLGGLAFLLRPNLVGIWLAVGLYWVSGARAPNRLSWSIVGGSGVIAAAAAVFAVVGGLSAFWDAAVIYNLAYSSDAPLADRIYAALQLGRQLSWISLPVAAGWCIAFGYRLLRRTRDERYCDLLSMSLILLPLEVVLVCVSGFHYTHYYITVFPAIIVFMAYSARLVIDFFGFIVKKHFATKEHLVAPAFVLGTFLFLFFSVFYYRYDHILQFAIKYTHDGVITRDVSPRFAELFFPATAERLPALENLEHKVRVAERVRSATEPGDRILVWGNGSEIYLFSERAAPTRFFYQNPLIKPGYATRSLVDEFISDVKDEMPAMIIDTRDRGLPPLEETARRDWRPMKRHEHDPDVFQHLFDLVETEYEVVGKDGAWILYGRK